MVFPDEGRLSRRRKSLPFLRGLHGLRRLLPVGGDAHDSFADGVPDREYRCLQLASLDTWGEGQPDLAGGVGPVCRRSPRPRARKGGCRCCWWSPKTSCSMRGAKKSSRSAVALRKSRVTQPRYCDCELRSRRHAARQSLSRNAVLVMRLRAPRPEPLAYAAASSPSHPRPAAATTHGRKHTIHRYL